MEIRPTYRDVAGWTVYVVTLLLAAFALGQSASQYCSLPGPPGVQRSVAPDEVQPQYGSAPG